MLKVFNQRLLPWVAAIFWLALVFSWAFLAKPSSSNVIWDLHLNGDHAPEYNAFDIFDPVPFQPDAIEALCSSKQWTPGLVFTCDRSVGAPGDVRNSILTCVRYAIEAGAALTLPKMIMRSPFDISMNRGGSVVELQYMFDRQHFVDSLRRTCPKLAIYSRFDEIPHYRTSYQTPKVLSPEGLFEPVPITGIQHPEQFRSRLFTWLSTHGDIQNLTLAPERPIIVALDRSYMQYPIYSDGIPFAHNFGRILRPRADAYTIAKHVVEALMTRHTFSPSPIKPNIQEPIPSSSFLGLHLDGEENSTAISPASVWSPTWKYSDYSSQRSHYLSFAAASNLSIIYIASTNTALLSAFRADTLTDSVAPVDVVTKFSLLREHLDDDYKYDHINYRQDLYTLQTMTRNQQSLVDYLVMQRSAHFCGMSHANFAWNVALRRHVYSSLGNQSLDLSGPQVFRDEFSTIYGESGGGTEYELCMWP